MNTFLWGLQILLAFFFGFNGITHINLPPDLPDRVAWMYDLTPGMHHFAGTAEIFAALGLILPGVTRIHTRLTTLAALGLIFVMFGAAAWHFPRHEITNVIFNLIVAGMASFVAYGRWKLHPLRGRRGA